MTQKDDHEQPSSVIDVKGRVQRHMVAGSQRVPWGWVVVFALALYSCGPLPPATPPASEIPSLQDRVRRSRADVESVVRLASGLWALGDQEGARRLLEESRAAASEVITYAAALGTASEGMGDYLEARDLYVEFLEGTRWSELSALLAGRIATIRGETATPLVRRLEERGEPLAHGQEPGFVVAIIPFQSPDDDTELAQLGMVSTELLMLRLREQGFFYVIDWETSEAARISSGGNGEPEVVARAVGDRLAAGGVLWGEVRRAVGDSVSFALHALRVSASGPATVIEGSFQTTIDSYSRDRLRLTRRAFEMLLGAVPESLRDDVFAPPPEVSAGALLGMGDGLLALNEGERDEARARFTSARVLEPTFEPLLDRLAQVESLITVGTAATLPLAEEILDLARRQTSATQLMKESAARSWFFTGPARQGLGELFGLDRLGSQLFLDLIISIDGESP